jgi:hypothetical protein
LIEAARQHRCLERAPRPGSFFLFHRERRWNPVEQRWMDGERGKLHSSASCSAAPPIPTHRSARPDRLLPSVEYVITSLDTQLPIDAERALVGALSHPLSKPRFDRASASPKATACCSRVDVSVVSGNRGVARVFRTRRIDPCDGGVGRLSDLFHEGSYVGKGSTTSTRSRPRSTTASRQRAAQPRPVQGSFTRGAGTDIHVVDDYPSHYPRSRRGGTAGCAATGRLRAGLGSVPSEHGGTETNDLTVISRWKILDNLRRSLLPSALVLLLACGWTILPGTPWIWTLLAFLVLAFPAYTQLVRSVTSRFAGVEFREHLRAEADTILTALRQAAFSVVFPRIRRS